MGVEVDLLVFEAAPQPLDEDVVHVAALAIPGDGDRMALQGVGEIVAGELAALVGIEDLRPAQAFDPDARRRLQALSLELTGLSAEGVTALER